MPCPSRQRQQTVGTVPAAFPAAFQLACFEGTNSSYRPLFILGRRDGLGKVVKQRLRATVTRLHRAASHCWTGMSLIVGKRGKIGPRARTLNLEGASHVVVDVGGIDGRPGGAGNKPIPAA